MVGGEVKKCSIHDASCESIKDAPICEGEQQDFTDIWLDKKPFWAVKALNPQTNQFETAYVSIDEKELMERIIAETKLGNYLIPKLATLDDIKSLLAPSKDSEKSADKKSYLERYGLEGFCRSTEPTSGGSYKWFSYKKYYSNADYLTFANMLKGAQDIARQFYEEGGIKLGWKEMKGLASCKELNLNDQDVIIRSRGAPKKIGPGEYESGQYLFVKSSVRLKESEDSLINVLSRKDDNGEYAVKIDDLSDERREVLIEHLENVYDEVTLGKSYVWWQFLLMGAGVITGALTTGLFFKVMWLDKRKGVTSEEAKLAGENVKFEDLVREQYKAQLEEWKEKGTFEQPYVDTDGRIDRILDVIQRPQGDMTNYLSIGPSRAGKTATTRRGLAQALVVAQMSAKEREALFQKTAAVLTPEEARIFRRTLEHNANRINKIIRERGFKGINVYYVPINELVAEGAVWSDKRERLLVKKVLDPVFKEAKQGYHIVLFLDEIQQAADGDVMRGRVALRDRLKEYVERDPRVSFAFATTVNEAATLTNDAAVVNRYATIFHEAASPNKTVQILLLKPYIKSQYGVDYIDPQAMKAIYVLGQRAHPKPSNHTAAENYFNDVLTAAREANQSSVTLDFVYQHYVENHASGAEDRALLTSMGLDRVFEFEARKIEAENTRDRSRFEKMELDAGEAERIGPSWWKATREQVMGEDALMSTEFVEATSDAFISEGMKDIADRLVETQVKALEESIRASLAHDAEADALIDQRKAEKQNKGARAFAISLLEEQAKQDPMLRVALRHRSQSNSSTKPSMPKKLGLPPPPASKTSSRIPSTPPKFAEKSSVYARRPMSAGEASRPVSEAQARSRRAARSGAEEKDPVRRARRRGR